MDKIKSKKGDNNLMFAGIVAVVGGLMLLSGRKPAAASPGVNAETAYNNEETGTDTEVDTVPENVEEGTDEEQPATNTSPLVRNSITSQDKADADKDRRYQNSAGSEEPDAAGEEEPENDATDDADDEPASPSARIKTPASVKTKPFTAVKSGERSQRVKALQQKMGIPATGIYDAATANTVKARYNTTGITSEAQYNAILTGKAAPVVLSTGYPLKLGSRGDKVKQLQRRLGLKPDGLMGKQTVAALRARFKITRIDNEQQFSRIISTGTSTQVVSSAFPMKTGSRGDKVAQLQRKLGLKADGKFGIKTAAALKAKYRVTMIVNEAQFNQIINTASVIPVIASQGAFPMRTGSKGDKVRLLQKKLGLKADGLFGKLTAATLQAKFGVIEILSEAAFNNILSKPLQTRTLPKHGQAIRSVNSARPLLKTRRPGVKKVKHK